MVLFDVTRLAARLLEGKRPAGVDRVSLAYIRHFRQGARALVRHWGQWVSPGARASQLIFAALLGEVMNPARTVRTAVAMGHVQGVPVPRDVWLFNTGHSGLDEPGYARAVERFGLRPVYFVHDLIPISHPEYCRDGEARRHEQRLRTILTTARGLIVNSADTGAELCHYGKAVGLPVPPLVVAPLGTLALPPPQLSSPCPQSFFVMLGTIEPRKNHLMMLHLWRQMIESGAPNMPSLVIIGQRGWECEQVLDLLERSPGLKTKVIEHGGCDDAELSTWLHHARALLFPSFVEGYGMPLAEALAHGVPVIASNLPVFREIAGDVPDYLDPLDGPGWRRLVLDYAQPGSPARAAQIVRMKGYAAPTWEGHFARVARFVAALDVESQHGR
jgi:glycosyltransferase involved in cell wall biosynthesis